MEIIIAEKAGFCFGVKRALKIARNQNEESGGLPVYTFGPLVHNAQVIKELEKEGIKSIEDLKANPRGILIIRTHGVSPDIKMEAESLGYIIVDATCPLVQKIHNIVVELKREEYRILIIGHAEHPEVQGIIGEVKDSIDVIENVEEAKQVVSSKKIGVVVQTTALWPEFKEITCELLEKAGEIRIFNTICDATMERQTAAEELAAKTDVIIIVGGKNSSNTRRLFEICKTVNPNSYLIETPDEINPEWLKGKEKIGLTAGASTPDEIVKSTYEKIKTVSESMQ